MKMPETRASEGAVLRLMYLVCAFAGINMQSGGSFLMSGMRELEEMLDRGGLTASRFSVAGVG